MVKFLKKYTECCEYAELYKDGKLIMQGDFYHDKICYGIGGYLKAYKDLGIEYEYSEKQFEKCPNYCDDTEDDWYECGEIDEGEDDEK